MDAETFAKQGLVILVILFSLALLGLFGYLAGYFVAGDVITGEEIFEGVTSTEPIPPIETPTATTTEPL